MENLQKVFDQVKGFSGIVSIALEDGTGYNLTKGSRQRGEDLPINKDTSFGIASGTKGFTAIMILKLIEEGKLSLESKVFELLPQDFPNMHKDVTVKHLLTHTSGIYDYFNEEIMEDFTSMFEKVSIEKIQGPGDMYPLLIEGKSYFQPGERFQYSNGGFVILGMVIEEVSGQSYEAFLIDAIVDPLNLSATGCFATNKLPPNVAIGYEEESDGTWRSNIFDIPPKCTGDGGLYTSAQDMDKLWRGLVEGRIISRPLLDQVLKVQTVIDNDWCYGLGFYILLNEDGTVKTYSLVGGDPGVSFTSRYYVEEKKTYTVISNTSFGEEDMNLALAGLL